MRTKLVGLAGIIAAVALTLGLGATAQSGTVGQSGAQHVVADNKGPATVER
ncbi:hypothetical protein [Streptomyces sp. NPDC059781]|uniref:hypothetical protein n=1 Tax=unclassified Streptomyces TaxID=2593676 RepID=UPI00365CF1AD